MYCNCKDLLMIELNSESTFSASFDSIRLVRHTLANCHLSHHRKCILHYKFIVLIKQIKPAIFFAAG